jgi:hypothetical protein
MAEHSMNMGHCIQFHGTSILAKKFGCMECMIREVIESELHPDNTNGEGFTMSRSWKPLIQILTELKKVLSKDK